MLDDSTFNQFFPLLELGLSKNPFGALINEEWIATTVPPPIVYDVLAEGFDHLQVIGDKGRGKSTTLHWLCHHFRLQGFHVAYERLPRWQFNYQTDLTEQDCFALDEAQRLFVLNQVRLFRQLQGKRLLIGTHISWERAFRRHGWQLTTIHIGDSASPEHIRNILDRRMMIFATGSGVQIYFDDSAVDFLWEQWGNNLRGMEFFLYHVIQKRKDRGAITAGDLEMVHANYVAPAGLD